MTIPSETFSATAAESALRPCSDLVCGRPATRLRGSTPSIKTPSLQSYLSPCFIASCGSNNTGVGPQRQHDLYSSLLRYVYIHSLFIIWRYIYIYIEREREGDRSRGRRPDPSFTIPYPLRPPTSEEHHHSRSPPAVCIYSFTIYKQERSSYRNEQPGISINEPGGAEKPWHHTISLDLRLLAPGHHHALVRSHIARLGIMGIVAAIIITCDM